MTNDRARETRTAWLAVLDRFKRDADAPGSERYWSPSLDCASREELVAIHYGCTEVSPHCGGYSCPASDAGPGPVTSHLMEDVQIWELVDSDSKHTVKHGERGLTVCTSLNSESSP